MQAHPKTAKKASRKHSKSHTFYAYVMWRIFQMLYGTGIVPDLPFYLEGLYLSYKDDLSEYHTKRIKRYIRENPWFDPLKETTDAASILGYETPQGREIIIEPAGVFSFKRGRHPHFVIADDVLRDPQVRMDISQIEKVTKLFMDEVVSLPKEGGELHVGGTPQDTEDLFWRLEQLGEFDCVTCPALINEATGEVLWPEMFPLKRLVQIRDKEIGVKSFLKEYQCRPTREVNAYFEEAEIDACIARGLKQDRDDGLEPLKAWKAGDEIEGEPDIIAGMDLGKKMHPSHFTAFKIEETKDGKRLIRQIVSKWFDHIDYTDQVGFLNFFEESVGMTAFMYDNTRAELESFAEQDELPACAEGVTMNNKVNFASAAALGKLVRGGILELLPDPRQKRQMLTVDDNLDAPSTKEGHGDCFFSNCLAARAESEQVTPSVGVVEVSGGDTEDDD